MANNLYQKIEHSKKSQLKAITLDDNDVIFVKIHKIYIMQHIITNH